MTTVPLCVSMIVYDFPCRHNLGIKFDSNEEQYDRQFVKWMMKEKVLYCNWWISGTGLNFAAWALYLYKISLSGDSLSNEFKLAVESVSMKPKDCQTNHWWLGKIFCRWRRMWVSVPIRDRQQTLTSIITTLIALVCDLYIAQSIHCLLLSNITVRLYILAHRAQ